MTFTSNLGLPIQQDTDTLSNETFNDAFEIIDRLFPVGIIWDWPADTLPNDSWMFPEGQAISRTTYAKLFALFGVKHGAGDGATTFNLPNLRNKFIFGAGGYTLGATGGNEVHSLPLGTNGYAEIAQGSNSIFSTQKPNVNWTPQFFSALSRAPNSTAVTAATTIGGTTEPGFTMPLFIALNRIIRVK